METVGAASDISTSAGQGKGHGKVILLGEHSVVYGRPAISAGLGRGCGARAERGQPGAGDTLSVEPWGVSVHAAQAENDPDRELLRRGFAVLCEALDARWRGLGRALPRPSVRVHATMEIPGGAGLGGSAALSVAVVRAIDAVLDTPQDSEALVAASIAWERVFHGNPSGVDSAMAVHGGLARYVRGQPLTHVRGGKPLQLVVGNSGEHGSTKSTVASVARQHARDPIKTEQIFDAVASLVNNAQSALEAGEHTRLGQLMDLNQKLLNSLLLSTTKLEEMCQIARGAGALGAKLTGGGGGGCMIALAADVTGSERIARALSDAGFAAFAVEVSS
jgi:mevalonate kinase